MRISSLRGLDSFSFLLSILQSQNATFQDLIINSASPIGTPALNTFAPESLLVLSTRPPIHDELDESGPSRTVERTECELEIRLFAALRPLFASCKRDFIEIAPEISACSTVGLGLSSKDKPKRRATYFQNGSLPGYQTFYPLNDTPRGQAASAADRHRTVVFVIITGPLWDAGPRLLASFGLNQEISLVWAYLLKNRYWAEFTLDVRKPRFLMAELECTSDIRGGPIHKDPHKNENGALLPFPETLSFASSWGVRRLIDKPL